MFQHLGRLCSKYPWLVVAAWIVVGAALAATAPNWDSRTQDDDVRFLPQRCPSVRAYQLLEKAFPKDVFASRLIFAVERKDEPLTEADFAIVDKMVDDLIKLSETEPELKLGSVISYKDGLIGGRLTSKDKQCTLIQVSLGTPFLALQTHKTVNRTQEVLQKRIEDAGDSAPEFFITGQAGIGRDLVEATGESLDETTIATIILVIVILLLVYRSPILALVPLVTIGVSVWVALNILAMMTLIPGVYLVNISKVFAIVILYGAGTDYCLFLISRYKEELENGASTGQALTIGVGAVGGALTASAGTVMCGLGLMSLAEFAKVRYSGPGIALSLAVALAASLTLTPALLRILGRVVFWPGQAPQAKPLKLSKLRHREPAGIWNWISRHVVKRPGVIFCVSILILAPLAILGCQVAPDYRATGQLSKHSESLKGLKVLQEHFPKGETGPITVLLASEKDWDSVNGRIQIDHLSRGFAGLDNVHEVRSYTQPLGTPLPEIEEEPKSPIGMLVGVIKTFQPNLIDNTLVKAKKAAKKYYLSEIVEEDGQKKKTKHVTRLDVILKSDPFDAESVETMKLIQTWLAKELPRTSLMGDLQTESYGVTVGAYDLAQVTESDRLRVNTLISIGILLILFLIVRSPLMAVYLLVTVLFSYLATLGATMLAGYLWAGELLFQLDWRVMFFLFTILVAVGEDYNILLVSRAVQEQKRHGPIEGMRRALSRTGGTITSCGLIMAGTFATLMLANLNTLLQIGFALAFGVLLDTFVVRPFLVPTFAILIAKTQQQQSGSVKRVKTTQEKIPDAMRMVG